MICSELNLHTAFSAKDLVAPEQFSCYQHQIVVSDFAPQSSAPVAQLDRASAF
jgi:hypothetical protein